MQSTELVDQVARSWRRLPAPARKRLRVGLSGGLDSSVLLHVLASVRRAEGFGLSAVHVHHGLVPGADRWGRHCGVFCANLDVPLRVVDVVVDRESPAGIEAAARMARRAALLAEGGVVALAHHRDDQAETVLFRAVRGAGVRGLAGMREIQSQSDGLVWRPLLNTSRAELEAYARAVGLVWIEDPSNMDHAHTRNYLRHELMPRLSVRFPGSVGTLARLGRLAGEASDLLDEMANEDRARLSCSDGSTRLAYAASLHLSSARWRNLLRSLLVDADPILPDEDRLREAERQFRSVGAPQGLRCRLGTQALCVYRDRWWLEGDSRDEGTPEGLALTSLAALRWAGAALDFRAVTGAGIMRAALIGAPVRIDRRRGGERLSLHPAGPSRTLKNLFQEAGIPPWLRPRLPVLWVGDRVAWVAGVGVAGEFRCPADAPGVVPEWNGLV
ncbi:MAG TPA: tRNA lysidine(34) synthetase TilS [Zoogloea sp.]|uniref:tRNA lysidine(34) synthetase TilS n=1 Tax=Zoogloea sp. TaxID=49181 RepID=UPI002B6DEC64|nr:tRNA lysidine(34) synthetase TilS [Zoogloea sp.]HNI48510.1 tRNA lysidine(34) synthetase TilS [Zoogloea sp.]